MEPARAASGLALLLLCLVAGRASAGVVTYTGINAECTLNADCNDVEYTTCRDAKCQCIDGFVNVGVTKCLPVATEYDDPCEVDSQCKPLTPSQNLIQCMYNTDTCRCPTNYHFAEAYCYPSSYLSDGCVSDAQCAVEHSSCQKYSCRCNDGFEAKGTNECVAIIVPCELDCSDFEHAECIDGTCQCLDGFVNVESDGIQCVPADSLPCASDEDCGALENTQCVEGECLCLDGFVNVGDDDDITCLPGLKGPCESDNDCSAVDNTECVDDVCKCSDYFAEIGGTCLPAIARPCETNTDCNVVEHTTCTDCEADNCTNVCKCADDFVSVNAVRCLPVASEYDVPCESDIQCKSLTPNQNLILCSPFTDTCRCPTGYNFAEQNCWFPSNLTSGCTSDYHCIVEYSSCQSLTCQCIEGFAQRDVTECYSVCEDIPGGFYDDEDCQCEDPDYVVNSDNSECIPIVYEGYGAECQDSRQCQKRMGVGAKCEFPPKDDDDEDEEEDATGTCACQDGYHYLHGHCWPEIAHGAACSSDEECQEFDNWSDYACVDDVCACAADAVGKRPGDSPLCRRVARENEECEFHLDCDAELTCDSSSSFCQASGSSHIFSNISHAKDNVRRSAPPKVPRIECGENEEPTFGENECVCEHGYFIPDSSEECVPELGMPCQVGEDLEIPTIEHSVCRRSAKFPYGSDSPEDEDDNDVNTDEDELTKDGVWACSGGFTPGPSKRECLATSQYDESCQHNAQCGYYGGICVEEKCQCDEEYRYEEGRSLCWPNKVGLDDPCTTDEDCATANVGSIECIIKEEINDGVCQCKEDYYPSEGDCKSMVLGGVCNYDDDCLFANGHPSVICKNGECDCSNGYYGISETECAFDLTVRCDLVEGAEENENGECVCTDPDYTLDGSKSECVPAVWGGILALCNDSVQCMQRMGQGAVCAGSACNCQQSFHYLRGRCWPTRAFGESCTADEECYQNAEKDAYVCSEEGTCGCAPYALPKGHVDSPICRRTATEGEECESDLDCEEELGLCVQPNNNALDTICRLSTRTASNPASNYTRAKWLSHRRKILATLKEEVTQTEDSEPVVCGLNEELRPSGTGCVCQRGYFRYSDNAECLPELGEPCYVGEEPEHQYIEYASCRRSAKFPYAPTVDGIFGGIDRATGQKDGVWACLGGFVAGPTNRICEKTRQNNYNCLEDAQCGYYGGICYDGRQCQCQEGQHYVTENLICWPTRGLHEVCTINADCGVQTPDSIECVPNEASEESGESTCTCKSDYHESADDCRRKAYQLGEECVTDYDCVFAHGDDKILCDYRQCWCKTGYFQHNDTACETGIGGSCSLTTDCRSVENAVCLDNKCECSDGYIRGSTASCLPVAQEYGDPCEDAEQCYVLTPGQEYIYCDYTSQTCQCWPNYHFHNNKCWNSKYLDQACEFASECVAEHSVCMNNYCTCEYGYELESNDRCKESSAPTLLVGSLVTLVIVAFASHIL